MTTEHATLYKTDSKGKVRVWKMEVDGNKYRSISGLEDGEKIVGDWTVVEGKNVGRANETTAEAQTLSEVESHYKKKLKEYHTNRDDIFVKKFMEPMTARTWNDDKKMTDAKKQLILNKGRGALQPKLDGFRSVVMSDGVYARSGDEYVTVPHIFEAAQKLRKSVGDIIFDGELYNHEYRADFNQISSLVKRKKPTVDDLSRSAEKVQLHVYDAFFPDEPNMTFSDRYEILGGLSPSFPNCFKLVDTYFNNKPTLNWVDELHNEFKQDGFEGSMYRVEGPYENKRSALLWKIKDWLDDEWTILDIAEGKGKWAGKALAFYYMTPAGKEFKATFVGSMEEAEKVWQNRASIIGLLGTVKYQEMTPDGAPRFGKTIKIHYGGKL